MRELFEINVGQLRKKCFCTHEINVAPLRLLSDDEVTVATYHPSEYSACTLRYLDTIKAVSGLLGRNVKIYSVLLKIRATEDILRATVSHGYGNLNLKTSNFSIFRLCGWFQIFGCTELSCILLHQQQLREYCAVPVQLCRSTSLPGSIQ